MKKTQCVIEVELKCENFEREAGYILNHGCLWTFNSLVNRAMFVWQKERPKCSSQQCREIVQYVAQWWLNYLDDLITLERRWRVIISCAFDEVFGVSSLSHYVEKRKYQNLQVLSKDTFIHSCNTTRFGSLSSIELITVDCYLPHTWQKHALSANQTSMFWQWNYRPLFKRLSQHFSMVFEVNYNIVRDRGGNFTLEFFDSL